MYKNPYEPKYQNLNNKSKKVGLKHYQGSEAFFKYSNHMQDIQKNIEEYNLGKKRKVLMAFDDIISNMISNKK